MIKKSQIKEVLLKYIVPLQKQYPDFYLGGSLALILQKHIPARDVKDLDIISPVSFGDLHETKFPYRGMVTSKKTYHIREIKTCLDFFHNPKAQYVTVKFQGHTIKLSPVNEIIHAKENKIWSPIYKQKQENLKQIIKEVFTEIKVQPNKIGLNSKIKKLDIILGKYNISGDEIGSKYPWTYAQEKLTPTTRNNAESFFSKLNITPTKISIGLVYRGELSNEEFNNLTDFEKINRLETERKAKSFYIEGNYKDTPIIIARKETRSPAAGQTYLISPYAKLKFNDVKDLPTNEILAALKIPNEGNVDEIKAQPGKTGLKDNRIKLVIQRQVESPTPDDNKLYGTLYVDNPESNFPKDSIVYSYEPSTDHMFLSSIKKESFDTLPKILQDKNIPYRYSDLGIVSGIHVDNLSKYFVLKKNMNEIKVQPVNKKIIKPTKKLKIMPFRSYIDMDASFMEDYILDSGDFVPIEDPIDIEEKDIQDGSIGSGIGEDSFAYFILDGNYKFYFGNNLRIDDILELNDPLSIKSFAEEQAKYLSSNHPEDESFYKEEIIRAIEIVQDNIPKYRAAEKILNNKYTIINDDTFSVILWSDPNDHFMYCEMVYKKDGYFNKDGDLVVYLNP
jgi:hypothetical protein